MGYKPAGTTAAAVSAVLARAGHQRATDERLGDSGFVTAEADRDDKQHVITVGYQDYDYPGYDNRTAERVHRICEEAFDRYAATLRAAGYTVENWMRYDDVRLGLFVTRT